MKNMVKALCEWNLVQFLSSDQYHINPFIQNLILLCDSSLWEDSFSRLIQQHPFVALHSDPNCSITLFEFFCTFTSNRYVPFDSTPKLDIRTSIINSLLAGDLATCFLHNAHNTRAFVGGLIVSILNHHQNNCELLCRLLDRVSLLGRERGIPLNYISFATNIAFPIIRTNRYDVSVSFFYSL